MRSLIVARGVNYMYQSVRVVPMLIRPMRRYAVDNSKLLVALSDLQSYGIALKHAPNFVVIGQQSSGKTSVNEALTNTNIFPKAMKMATMKPMKITTIRSEETKYKIGDKEFRNENEAADEVNRLNNNPSVQQVVVTVWSPKVYNSSYTDTPGLFSVTNKSNTDMPKKIKELIFQQLQDPNVIPVVIHSGPSDPATDQALKFVEKFNRQDDALGVITKVDLLEKQNTDFIAKLLNGEEYALGHGWVGVSLRSDKDIEAGMSIEDKIMIEKNLMAKMKLKPSGVETLRKMIADIHAHKIKDQLPNIIKDIDVQIDGFKVSQTFLHDLVANDPKKLAGRLSGMIEKLVGSSTDRSFFEDRLKKKFKEVITGYLEETFDTKTKNRVPQFTPRTIDKTILAYQSSNQANPVNFQIDGIKELFSFGSLSPTFIDTTMISKALNEEQQLAACINMIDLVVDDPLNTKRLQWNKYLNAYFKKLLHDDNMHRIIHDITQDLMLEYIYNESEEQDEVAKKFAEYMVKEISNEAYESNIRYSITAILNLEKRPEISIVELVRYITQMYPNVFTFHGGLAETIFHEKRKLKVEVYGDDWNEAYLRVVCDKMAYNCYRNVAVNLLDKMVRKLIEMSLDMTNKEQALKEQNKVNQKIRMLESVKDIIQSHTSKNNSKNEEGIYIRGEKLKSSFMSEKNLKDE